MPVPNPGAPILETIRRSGHASIVLDGACWLVWLTKRRFGVSAAMSSVQFVQLNAPILDVRQKGRME